MDDALACTAVHAARCKAAAVAEGYWTDQFAGFFARGCDSPGPLINCGQYVRVAAIRSIVQRFLEAVAHAQMPAQIVSLGAGFDALFWQLSAAGVAPRLFIELDQGLIVRRKHELISTTPALQRALEPCATTSTRGGAPLYHLAEADLNDVNQMAAALDAGGWQASQPTLIIAECVLVYLRPEASNAIVGWFTKHSPCAALIAYDAIGPDDPFGKMMIDNLKQRGCPLLGLRALPDTAAHEARCMRLGWSRACAISMLDYHDRVISHAERARISKIAMLDELEEWRMLLDHYCIVFAVHESLLQAVVPSPLAGLELRTPVVHPPFSNLQARGESPPSLRALASLRDLASDLTCESDIGWQHGQDGVHSGYMAVELDSTDFVGAEYDAAAASGTSGFSSRLSLEGSTLRSFQGNAPAPLGGRIIEDPQDEGGWE